MLFFLAYQGMAESSSAVIGNQSESNIVVVAIAWAFFGSVVLFGCYFVGSFVHKKVWREHRAVLRRDSKTNILQWQDAPSSMSNRAAGANFYSGFVDKYGAMFARGHLQMWYNKSIVLCCIAAAIWILTIT